MALTVGESCAVQTLLRYLLNYDEHGIFSPDGVKAMEAAVLLAERASKTLSAGMTGEKARALWTESAPAPGRKAKARRR